MIIDEEIKIKNTPSNRKLYNNNSNEDYLIISINDLKDGSHVKINVKCDICGLEKIIAYRVYLRQFRKHDIYVCSGCRSHNIKKSFLEKYGVENVFQNEEIKRKSKNTIKNKYGVEFITQNKEIKNLIMKNNLKKYGVEYYNNNEKAKITNLKKYGNVCSLHNKDIDIIVKRGWLEKYGTEYPMQNINVFNKMSKKSLKIHKYKEFDITYQSSYEKDFLDKYFEKIKIQNGPTIRYLFNNKQKIYFPDFYLPEYNLIVEIKSTRIFEMEITINEMKKNQCKKDEYNFLFIIDKKYEDFEKFIESHSIS